MTLFDVGNTGRMAAIYNFRREYEKAQDKSDTGKRCDPPQPHIAKVGGAPGTMVLVDVATVGLMIEPCTLPIVQTGRSDGHAETEALPHYQHLHLSELKLFKRFARTRYYTHTSQAPRAHEEKEVARTKSAWRLYGCRGYRLRWSK